ncbi:MAG: hypothetical protein ACOY35_06750 [Bacillota bacterium]
MENKVLEQILVSLEQLDTKLGSVEKSFQEQLDTKLGNMEKSFQEQLDTRLGNMEKSFQEQLDTRLGSVEKSFQEQFKQLNEKLDQMDNANEERFQQVQTACMELLNETKKIQADLELLERKTLQNEKDINWVKKLIQNN